MIKKPKKIKKWYVYAIECDNNSVYIGQTFDLANRWILHCTGKGADWTKKHKPVRLFHFETVNSFIDAFHKEKEWKTSNGRRKLKKILLESDGKNIAEKFMKKGRGK